MKLLITVLLLGILLSGCNKSAYIQPTHQIEDAHGGGSRLVISSDNRLVASGGWSGYVRIWVLKTGKKLHSMRHHFDEVSGLLFVKDNRQLLTASYDGRINLVTLEGRLLKQVKTHSSISAFYANEDLGLILTGHKDGKIRSWDFDLKPNASHFVSHGDWVRSIAYDIGKKMVASSDGDGFMMLQNLSGKKILKTQVGNDIRKLLFSLDGQHLYGSTWFDLHRWSLDTFRHEILETDHRGIIVDMEFDSLNDKLFTISRQTDSSVYALDPLNGKTQDRYSRHKMCGSSLELSSDNRYLVTSSDDASVHIWDLMAQ